MPRGFAAARNKPVAVISIEFSRRIFVFFHPREIFVCPGVRLLDYTDGFVAEKRLLNPFNGIFGHAYIFGKVGQYRGAVKA